MQIIRDERLVERRKKIGQITSLLGMGVLMGGMALTWFGSRWGVPIQWVLPISLVALAAGFILSSIGIYFLNRWGRSPRPDELIDQGLKGLGREYRLYHFGLPAPHLLLTPSGLVALIIRTEPGEYGVQGDRWRRRFSVGRALRFMGQEGLGNPTKDAHYQVERMRRFLSKLGPEMEEIPVSAIVVFLAQGVSLDVAESSVPVLRAAKLKGFLRSEPGRRLPASTYRELAELLDGEAR